MRTYFKSILVLLLAVFSLILTHPKGLVAIEELPIDDTDILISMDFQDADLKDVLKIFSIQSGLNFVASEAVQDRKITLYFDRVPLKDAMDKLFRANNLTYELGKDSNIFMVKDWGKPSIETVTKIFTLKYATVSTSSLKEEMKRITEDTEDPASASSSAGSSSSSSSSASSSSSEDEGGKWKQEDEAGITRAVKKLLSEQGSLIEDYRTNSLIVTDVPSRMTVISQTIAALDTPVPQVLIEVEMLDVSKNTVDQLGVTWPQRLLQLTVPGSKETSFPFWNTGTSGIGRTIDPEEGVFGGPGGGWDFGPWAANKFGPSILTVIGGTIALDYLRTQTDTKYLARPRIITLNNETAEIRITTNEAIGLTQEISGAGASVSTSTTTAERTQTGVFLRVTPQINPDTGEITMFIVPSVTDTNASNIAITTGTGTTATTANIRDPETRATRSTVRIKDGETVVLGGLIRNRSTEVIQKLPILGDIPLVGALFRHKTKTPGEERELLVFITPHIIKDRAVPGLARARNSNNIPTAASVNDRQLAINSTLNKFEK